MDALRLYISRRGLFRGAARTKVGLESLTGDLGEWDAVVLLVLGGMESQSKCGVGMYNITKQGLLY